MKSDNEKVNILYNFLHNKYDFNDNVYLIYSSYTNTYFGNFYFWGLEIVVDNFKKWNDLLKKGYSDEELSNYLIEAIKKSLPDLKGEIIIIQKGSKRLLEEKI